MQTITQFDPKSVANTYGFFLGVSLFLTGVGVGIINIIQRLSEGGGAIGTAIFIIIFNVALGALVGLISAILAAIIGYISGYIIALLYNWAVRVKFLGGVKVEIK